MSGEKRMPGHARRVLVDDLLAGLVERRGPLIDAVLALRLRAAAAASPGGILVVVRLPAAIRALPGAVAASPAGARLLLDVGEALAVGAP